MSEPADRHEVHAQPAPSWHVVQSSANVDGTREVDEVSVDLRPDHPIMKLFAEHPDVETIELHNPVVVSTYRRVDQAAAPDYGMASDEGNFAVDLAVEVLSRYMEANTYTIEGAVFAIEHTILAFGERYDVGFAEVSSGLARDRITSRLIKLAGGE